MTKPPLGTFFYKVSYKNPSTALPILLADFAKLFSSITDFGSHPLFDKIKGLSVEFQNQCFFKISF
ncbi:MAG TPA: hypothetical protein HPP56_05060 [Nitrospirae bacterium]|nr:hypothetical protein [Nitrospirota bacterium]